MSNSINGYSETVSIENVQGNHTYFAKKQNDHGTYMIKSVENTFNNAELLQQLANENYFLQQLTYPGIPSIDKYLKTKSYHTLITADFSDYKTLAQHIKSNGAFNVKEFIDCAIDISLIIEQIHIKKIIHKNINPNTIYYNHKENKCLITGFKYSSSLAKHKAITQHPSKVEGDLKYIAPEQTGRTSRAFDHRVDLYSLGMIFYEMLYGKSPIETDELLKIIYFQLVTIPKKLHDLNSSIPQVLCDITQKLFSKSTDERYFSISGLLTDLIKCKEQFEKNKKIEKFKLGESDYIIQWQIPEKIYGMKDKISLLKDTFSNVINDENKNSIVLISGTSGVGKTSLIQELYKDIIYQTGYFVSGKYDHYKKTHPYFALQQALAELVTYLQSETKDEYIRIKSNILKAVGVNGKILTNLIPGLEYIIGVQPDVAELPAKENQVRMNIVIISFIKVLAVKEHPIVIFLDDLQWTDYPSISLIEELLLSKIPYFFLIGAYRDNEVDSDSTFYGILQSIEKKKFEADIINIQVGNLALNSIINLIEDVTGQEVNNCKSLAEEVLIKTQGNPFFVQEFLKYLYESDLFVVNEKKSKSKGRAIWDFDIELIKKCSVTENVLDLLLEKINSLNPDSKKVLQYASFIGNTFDSKLVSAATKLPAEEVIKILYSTENSGFWIVLNEDKANNIFTFKFAHDKIYESAYSSVPDIDKNTIYYKIGIYLYDIYLNNNSLFQKLYNLKDLVLNLNNAKKDIVKLENTTSQIISQSELAQLNFKLSKTLIESTSYDAAYECLQFALLLLPKDHWNTLYDLTLSIYNDLQKIVLFINKGEELIPNHAAIVKNKRSMLDTMYSEIQVMEYKFLIAKHEDVENLLVHCVNVANNLDVSNNFSLEVKDPNEIYNNIINTIKNYDFNAKNYGFTKLSIKADYTFKILSVSIINCIYLGDPKIILIFAYYMLKLNLKYGNSKFSAETFCWINYILSANREYDLTYKCAQYAYELTKDKLTVKKAWVMDSYVIIASIYHSNKELYPIIKQAIDESFNNGELEYAGITYAIYLCHLFCKGEDLKIFLSEYDKYCKHKALIKVERAHGVPLNMYVAIKELINYNSEYNKKTHFMPKKESEYYNNSPFPIIKVTYNLVGMVYNSIFNNYNDNISMIEEINNIYLAHPVVYMRIMFEFYASLSLYRMLDDSDKFFDKNILSKASTYQEKFYFAVKIKSTNMFNHQWQLLEAEKNRINKNYTVAENCYIKALKLAKKSKVSYEEAIISELFGQFLIKREIEIAGQQFIINAFKLYTKIGALKKVKHMLVEYPQIFDISEKQQFVNDLIKTTNLLRDKQDDDKMSEVKTVSQSELNLQTISKLSGSISKELNLDKLLEKYVSITLENIGAKKCFLILINNEKFNLKIEALSSSITVNLEQQYVSSLQEYSKILSYKIVQQVLQKKSYVLINNLDDLSKPLYDDYTMTLLQANKNFSIFCLPIINLDEILGFIYLENDLYDSFSKGNIKIAEMLTSQVAISIKNSQLYNNLERKVKERTKELSNTLSKLQTTKDELVESEKMASIGRLIKGIAHELNTPVGNIMMAYSIVWSKIRNEFKENQNKLELFKDLNIEIEGNLNFISDLVKKIKLILQDNLDQNKHKVKLHDFIEQILVNKFSQYNQTNIIFKNKDVDFAININLQALQIVLEIIMENCFVHAYPSNGSEIKIEIDFGTHEKNKNYISITDFGVGISKENLLRIYEPFFTTSLGLKKKVGLGLYIAYSITSESLGGKLLCESNQTQTKFIINI